jgi:iron-sulfur cluster repair protein YtfE (RIC family)
MSESILNTLREEHRQSEHLMELIERCEDVAQKKELYLQLKSELILHMKGEEQTLYVHLMDDVGDKEAGKLAQQADAEHQEVKDLLSRLDNTGIESPEWKMLFQLLKDNFHKHVEEEENALFSEAKEDFSKEELEDFGDEFKEAKSHIDPEA